MRSSTAGTIRKNCSCDCPGFTIEIDNVGTMIAPDNINWDLGDQWIEITLQSHQSATQVNHRVGRTHKLCGLMGSLRPTIGVLSLKVLPPVHQTGTGSQRFIHQSGTCYFVKVLKPNWLLYAGHAGRAFTVSSTLPPSNNTPFTPARCAASRSVGLSPIR